MVFTDLPVGDGPSMISSGSKTSFRFPRPGEDLGPRGNNPRKTHDSPGSFGVIYVNDLGRTAMLAAKPTLFAVGSIIVREKLAKMDDKQPQLVAAMVKRASGFSPKTGDWEYLILDGSLKKIRERRKKGACLDCHESQRARDFVYSVSAPK